MKMFTLTSLKLAVHLLYLVTCDGGGCLKNPRCRKQSHEEMQRCGKLNKLMLSGGKHKRCNNKKSITAEIDIIKTLFMVDCIFSFCILVYTFLAL